MLRIHGNTGIEMGVDEDNIFICSNGDVVEMLNGECTMGERVPAGAVYLDSASKGVSNKVMADRQVLAEDGFVAVLLSVDSKNNKLMRRPQIISRGFVFMKESGPLLRKIQNAAQAAVEREFKQKTSFGRIKQSVIKAIGPLIYKEIKRNPIIAPVIMNKK
jgi:ribonuclease J